MEIARGMVDAYLSYITEIWIEDNGVPSKKMDDYYDAVMQIKHDAEIRNDIQPLRLGLDYLLCHDEISLENHGIVYSWQDNEVRDVIRYLRHIVFPNEGNVNCKEVENVILTQMTDYQWWRMRTEQGIHPDFSKSQGVKRLNTAYSQKYEQ